MARKTVSIIPADVGNGTMRAAARVISASSHPSSAAERAHASSTCQYKARRSV
jgi:hypothetical protein